MNSVTFLHAFAKGCFELLLNQSMQKVQAYLKNRSIGSTNEVQLIHNEQRHLLHFLPGGLPPPPTQHVPILRGANHDIGLPQHGVVSQGVPSEHADVEPQARGAELLGPVCEALLGELLLGGDVDRPGTPLACAGLQHHMEISAKHEARTHMHLVDTK